MQISPSQGLISNPNYLIKIYITYNFSPKFYNIKGKFCCNAMQVPNVAKEKEKYTEEAVSQQRRKIMKKRV